jgi:hypothetical protein
VFSRLGSVTMNCSLFLKLFDDAVLTVEVMYHIIMKVTVIYGSGKIMKENRKFKYSLRQDDSEKYIMKLAYICSMFTKFLQQTHIVTLSRCRLCFLRTVVFRITAPCSSVGGEFIYHVTGVIRQKTTVIKFTTVKYFLTLDMA